MEKDNSLKISKKSFITSLAVIFALMLFTYILTFILPGGTYQRTVNASGNTIVDTAGDFSYIEGGLPFWKWILSPVLVLGADGNSTLVAVIAFLLIIGGVFKCLECCGFMNYMLDTITSKFGKVRYRLMTVLLLFFMLMGSFIGSFEEVVPMVPIVVALSVNLGWDAITGLAMSLLAAGCGFAVGVCNPFSVGIAQKLAGLPMFSGIWFRAMNFILVYSLLVLFVRSHARKIDTCSGKFTAPVFEKNDNLSKALVVFSSILGTGILIVLSSSVITVLQDYTMIIIALMFLIGGIAACSTAKMNRKDFTSQFISGLVSILPSVLMILMASSIKYILVEGKIQDTLLHMAIDFSSGMPKWAIILFIYLIVLVMNFFIGSGSAKAFMMIPLIVPLAQAFGISAQLCIVAFAFGDGFSNVFYPTNAALLISLGLAGISYGKWAKWALKFQTANIILTSLLLLLGLAIGI